MTLTIPPLMLRAVQAAIAAVVLFGLFAGASEDVAPSPEPGDVVAFVDRTDESERWVIEEKREDGMYLLSRLDSVGVGVFVAAPEEVEAADRE